MSTWTTGANADLLGRLRSIRDAGTTTRTCLFQFATGERCALEHGHAANGDTDHVAISKETGTWLVTRVTPADPAPKPQPAEPTTPSGQVYAEWAGARVREAIPPLDSPTGTVVVPNERDWAARKAAYLPACAARLVVEWSDGSRSWMLADDLVRLDRRDQPLAERHQGVRGLRCHILLPASRPYTGGGAVAHRVQEVTLIGELANKHAGRVSEPTADAPAVTLWAAGGMAHARELERPDGVVGPMFNGAFIYSSDSRFGDISREAGLGGGPIPLHDRYETPAQYAALTSD